MRIKSAPKAIPDGKQRFWCTCPGCKTWRTSERTLGYDMSADHGAEGRWQETVLVPNPGCKAWRNEEKRVRYHVDYDGKVERWRWYMVQCAVCRLLYCFSSTTQNSIKDIVLVLPLPLSARFATVQTVRFRP